MTAHEFNEPGVTPDSGLQGPNDEYYYCDICSTEFETLVALIEHLCAVYQDTPADHYVTQDAYENGPQVMTDGGRPKHRANCHDYAWSYSDPDQVDVSDQLERHARKEQHDVRFERAVATDGGTPTVTACPECDHANVRGRTTLPAASRWKCYECRAMFPEPARRPSRRSEGKKNLRADGGTIRHPGGGIETLAGVADQHPVECVAGRPDCPGPDAPGDDLPCLDCLSDGGEP